MELRVALAQMAIHTGQPELNEAEADRLARQAAAQGAHLLLLPELWAHGYDLARAEQYAASLDAGPFAVMAELARKNRLSIVVEDGGRLAEANAELSRPMGESTLTPGSELDL
jgi:predicted amidohydrolase